MTLESIRGRAEMTKVKDIGYRDQYIVRTNEIDRTKHISVPALIQLMQEASMHNAMKLKVSVWDLASKHLSWVLLRKEIHIEQLPSLGEKLIVQTYPSGFDRVLAYRDFLVFDSQGNSIATASSTWVLMNTLTRKMERIPIEEFNIPTPEDVTLLQRPQSKLALLSNPEYSEAFKVNWLDLDWNNHVNNVFILKCIFQGVPARFLQHRKLKKICIHFKNESLWKDKLVSNFELVKDNISVHNLVRIGDEKEIARAEIEWYPV